MSRKKGKSKAKGSAKSTPRRKSTQHQLTYSWPAQNTPMHSMSLVDEARWMSTHRTAAFEANKRLRNMPIKFISAGHLCGTLEERQVVVESNKAVSTDDSVSPSHISILSQARSAENIIAMAQMAIRSPSPIASQGSSSGDEVVFKGRGPTSSTDPLNTVKVVADSTQSGASPLIIKSPTPQVDVSPNGSQLSVAKSQIVKTTTPVDDLENPTIIRFAHPQDVDSDTEGVIQEHFEKRRGGKPAWEGASTDWEHRSKPGIGWLPSSGWLNTKSDHRRHMQSRDAAMEDYMQNIEEFGLHENMMATSSFARREMGLDTDSHNDWESTSEGQDDEDIEKGDTEEQYFVDGDDSWDSGMIQDFEDISTSSGVVETIVRILSKRTRKSGLQYLCVYEGSMIDEARWLPSRYLDTTGDQELIRTFEQKVNRRENQISNESTSEREDSFKIEDEEEEFDDETIARALQKQEELGLGSDEMLLYTGDHHFSKPTTISSTEFERPNKKQQKSRARRTREHTFPSASAMADALAMDPYGGFDIMDTDRPSLKAKKKGRRGHMPLELEDSDLNDQLQNSWEADRAKKRLKKAEREELRQQGLLGRNGKRPNLKVKYQGGVEMQEVVEEIREFLLSEMQSLSLPPMEAHRRAIIHQVVACFDLKSRSRGDGVNRFTVLSKTPRTRTWTDDEFNAVIQHKNIVRRLRGPLQGQSSSRPIRSIFAGPRTRVQVGYRDGDTVGANAPELGPENKGHELLKKMGWSKGIGLGALNNKGILQPIPHVVKTNKAGLQ